MVKKWVHRSNDPIYSGFSFVDYLMENGLEKCHVFLDKMKNIIDDAKEKGFLPVENPRRISLQATDMGLERSFKPKYRA